MKYQVYSKNSSTAFNSDTGKDETVYMLILFPGDISNFMSCFRVYIHLPVSEEQFRRTCLGEKLVLLIGHVT